MVSRLGSPDAMIVIFGAALRRGGRPSTAMLGRVQAAARFGARFGSPLYLPTGGVLRPGPSEASVMRDLLIGLGIDPDRIVPEETATDTLSSVRAVHRLIEGIASDVPVYAASSGYHLPRCILLMRLAGIRAQAVPPARLTGPFLLRWYWRLRELPALPYDAALMIWSRLMTPRRRLT